VLTSPPGRPALAAGRPFDSVLGNDTDKPHCATPVADRLPPSKDGAQRIGANNTTTRGLVLKQNLLAFEHAPTLRSGSTDDQLPTSTPCLAARSFCWRCRPSTPSNLAAGQRFRPTADVHTSPCGQVFLSAGVGLPRYPTLRPGNASVQLPTSTPCLAARSFLLAGVGLPRHPTLRPGNASVQLPTSAPRLAARSFCWRVSTLHAVQPCGRATLRVNRQPVASHLAMTGTTGWRKIDVLCTLPCRRGTVCQSLGSICRRTCWTPFHGFQPATLARPWGCGWLRSTPPVFQTDLGDSRPLCDAVLRQHPIGHHGAAAANHRRLCLGAQLRTPKDSDDPEGSTSVDCDRFGRHPLPSRRIWTTADLSAIRSCDRTRLAITE